MLKYNFEFEQRIFEQRIKVGFIGCGGHSFRNIYPTFQYAPVDLNAVCDLNKERADIYARQFVAKRAYDGSTIIDTINQIKQDIIDGTITVSAERTTTKAATESVSPVNFFAVFLGLTSIIFIAKKKYLKFY